MRRVTVMAVHVDMDLLIMAGVNSRGPGERGNKRVPVRQTTDTESLSTINKQERKSTIISFQACLFVAFLSLINTASIGEDGSGEFAYCLL
jgi:hypothetical protein